MNTLNNTNNTLIPSTLQHNYDSQLLALSKHSIQLPSSNLAFKQLSDKATDTIAQECHIDATDLLNYASEIVSLTPTMSKQELKACLLQRAINTCTKQKFKKILSALLEDVKKEINK